MKKFQIVIFGKPGCDKCEVMENRVDALLKKPEWDMFEKHKINTETESGLVSFCSCECLNPQRLPAMVIKQYNTDTEQYELIRNTDPVLDNKECGNSILYTYLGLQTDYTGKGKGIISPKMIKSVLQTAIGIQG